MLHNLLDDLVLASERAVHWLLLFVLHHLEGHLLGAVLDALSLWLGLSVFYFLDLGLKFGYILLQLDDVLGLNLNNLI